MAALYHKTPDGLKKPQGDGVRRSPLLVAYIPLRKSDDSDDNDVEVVAAKNDAFRPIGSPGPLLLSL